MKNREAALTGAVVSLFLACGRLDLGDYAALRPSESDGAAASAPPKNAPSGGSQAAGGAPGGSNGSEAETAGQPPLDDGGRGGGPTAGAGSSGEAAGGVDAGGATAGGEGGEAGEGATVGPGQRSCKPQEDICGKDRRSCCATEYVRAGEVVRGGLQASQSSPAPSRVSGFHLGTFEVTVGRFQIFLKNYDAWRETGAPHSGAGQHPLHPGSGWNPNWSRRPGDPPERYGLGVDSEEVKAEVSYCLDADPLLHDVSNQPVNCVSFYEAMAFCIWDGGRLPTDLEWEYAAAGGDENRTYPWGMSAPNGDFAMYGCISNIGSPCMVPPVGYHVPGAGRFGHLGLAGSVAEWTFDALGEPLPNPCHDCATVEQIYDANPRGTRGGSWNSSVEELKAATRPVMEARVHLPYYGFRCAYDALAPPDQN